MNFLSPTYLSLFSGIGGFDLALDRAGFQCLGQIEIDPFCWRVLERRWPDVGRAEDIRAWQPRGSGGWRSNESLTRHRRTRRNECERGTDLLVEEGQNTGHCVDLLIGGFPCQDLSIAGKRAGLGGERSGLFWEIIRIAKALQPTWGLFENVPGLFSSHGGRDMATVLEGLRQCWPVVGYRVLDSRHFGVAQRRRRVFFVCGPDEARVASVLFEPEVGGGDTQAGGEAGAHVAASLTSGSHRAGVNEPGRRVEDDVNLVVSPALKSGGNDRHAEDQQAYIVAATLKQRGRGATDEVMDNLQVVHALSSEGADASEDGTGRGTPIIPIQYVEQWGRDKRQNGVGIGLEGEPSFTLDASYPHGFAQASTVRRLTPVECEKLQAFPPGWTCLCQPLEAYAADPEGAAERCVCPDSPRYRALGNAVTVSVVEWIGRQLLAAITARAWA